MSSLVNPTYEELQAHIIQLERDCQKISERFEDQTTFLELFTIMQRVSAKKVSYAHQKLYNALVELYPDLLADTPTIVIPFKVREAAGWPHKNTWTGFAAAMKDSGAFLAYELQPFNGNAEKEEDKRPALVTPNPDVFPYPNLLDLVSTEKLKKSRDEQRKKQQEMAAAWRLWQCTKCGSPDIEYGIIPKCKSCGQEHTRMEGIAAERITIAPVGEVSEDDWDAMAADYEANNIINFPTELTENDFNAFGRKRG